MLEDQDSADGEQYESDERGKGVPTRARWRIIEVGSLAGRSRWEATHVAGFDPWNGDLRRAGDRGTDDSRHLIGRRIGRRRPSGCLLVGHLLDRGRRFAPGLRIREWLLESESTEVVAKRTGVRVSSRRILEHEPLDDRDKSGGQVIDELTKRGRLIVHLFVRDRYSVLPGEGHCPSDHLVHHNAERVQVASRVGLSTLGLLGREVGGGSHHRTGLSQVRLGRTVHETRDAEVGDFHHPVRTDENVGRLDVAMGDAGLVRETKSRGNLTCDFARLTGIQPPTTLQHVSQCAALDELHGDEVGALELAPVIDVDNVGVTQACCGLRLPAESLHELWIDSELWEQHLHRDVAVQEKIMGQENISHAPAAHPPPHGVALVDDRRVGT